MPTANALRGPIYFGSAEEFRAWLAANSATAEELVVGFYKLGTGRPSITWPESVDEALCVGWIDGVRKRIDDHAYQIRFTPRKKGSIWSTVNIARVEALDAAGRMTRSGLEMHAQRVELKSSVYSYEQKGSLHLAPGELTLFKQNERGWGYFEKVAPSYRKTMIYWVVSAKKEATRARRLAKFIDACAAGKRLLK